MFANRITRRDFLKVSSVAAAGAAIAACAPQAAAPPPAPAPAGGAEAPKAEEAGPVTLNYWFCWSGIYQEKQRKILDTFEQEFEGKIKIADLTVPSNIRDKMLTAVAAGASPDAAACFGDVVTLAAKGAFMSIDDYVKASSIIKLDALYKPRVEATFWRGKQYGFPYNCSAELMLWNSDILNEIGVDPTKQIETWDELTKVSKELVKFDASGNLARAAYTTWYPRHAATWFWINGGDAYDSKSDKITIDQPQNVEGLQTVIDYAWNVYGDVAKADDFNAGAGSEAESPFCVGAMAVTYAGDWDPSTYHTWCPSIKMWPQLFPKAAKGTELVAAGAGDFQAILRGAPNPDQAYQFIEWMVMKGNKMWTEAGVDTNCVVADAGIVRSDWPDIFGDKAAELSKWWAQAAALTKPVENFPAYGYMNDELKRVYDLALHKQMTAAEALAEAQKNVQGEMDKYTVS
jgi:ABC-type glycerol-3-phosphate transport system substrate-binding protein